MSNLQCIECDKARELLDQGAVIFDIRDQGSFTQGHPGQAKNLNNDNFQQLLQPIKKEQIILVLCYHGNSSKSAAQYISSQGFENTFSVNGGFEAWQALYPDDVQSLV